MKRPLHPTPFSNPKTKNPKQQEDESDEDKTVNSFSNLGEDMLFEVLKRADARTLGRAACVSKQWNRTALDERLWELICTRHCANIGCGHQQLRLVVLPLGGFRRLYSKFLWRLSKPAQSGSAWATPFSRMVGGKDEVHLSLSLLSVGYYEKMNFRNSEK